MVSIKTLTYHSDYGIVIHNQEIKELLMTEVMRVAQGYVDAEYENLPEMTKKDLFDWLTGFHDCGSLLREESDEIFSMYAVGEIFY